MKIKRVLFMGGKPVGDAIYKHIKEDVVASITNTNAFYNSSSRLFFAGGLKNEEAARWVKEVNPDLIVVAYYDYILPKEIIDIPKYGCINVHLADAERYRGCYPTTRAILNGDKEYGVTIHYIDEGIDTGDILYKTNFKIPEHTTGKELYDMATKEGIEAFKEFWPKFKAGELKGRKQQYCGDMRHGEGYPREFPNRKLDLDLFESWDVEKERPRTVEEEILAFDFPPYEGAYIMIGDKKYKLVCDDTTT